MAELDRPTKLKLMEFVCSFAWADLSVHPSERQMVFSLMEKLHIDDPEDRKSVVSWLKSPPPFEDLDPLEIPREHRDLFIDECEVMIRADGVIKPEEADAIRLLREILDGVDRKEKKKMTKAHASNRGAVVDQLNKILQLELAGVSRYLHYSFLVFGPSRIPIVAFFRGQANESMTHAVLIGEKITSLGGHPTILIESPPEPPRHDVRTLLQESVEFERRGLGAYRELLSMCGEDVALEELARSQIRAETEHIEEVEKMLRGAEK
jgi:bacterioferritin